MYKRQGPYHVEIRKKKQRGDNHKQDRADKPRDRILYDGEKDVPDSGNPGSHIDQEASEDGGENHNQQEDGYKRQD